MTSNTSKTSQKPQNSTPLPPPSSPLPPPSSTQPSTHSSTHPPLPSSHPPPPTSQPPPPRRSRSTRRGSYKNTSILTYTTSLSHRVTTTTKRKIWDSPSLYVDTSQQVVDGWERLYVATKGGLISVASSAKSLYLAAKVGAESFENRLLLPIRDYFILPLFSGGELFVAFVLSERMSTVVSWSLLQIEYLTPLGLGRTFLVPAIKAAGSMGAGAVRVMQYPIPTQATVAKVTTNAVEGVKIVLGKGAREIR